MTFSLRVGGICAALIVLALPAHANNPPRPDGVLYLILVFPLISVCLLLARVIPEKQGLARRLGRGAFFTLCVLAATAGTELGFLAMVVIVLYGLVRSAQMVAKGKGPGRWVCALLAAAGTLAAGVGYVWALWNAPGAHWPRQKRTMVDMRTIGTAVSMWAEEQRVEASAGEIDSAAAFALPEATSIAAPQPRRAIAFGGDVGPPRISVDDLEALLVPEYLKTLPWEDGWRRPYDFRLDRETLLFQFRSGGADRRFDGDEYEFGPNPESDYDRDIVYADGEFVCWPEEANLW